MPMLCRPDLLSSPPEPCPGPHVRCGALLQVNANLTVYVALACLVAASGGVLFGKFAVCVY